MPAAVPPPVGRLTRLRVGLAARLRTREFRNTLLYVLSSAFGAGLGILTLPLFSKYLSVSDFGAVGYVTAVNGFLLPLFTLRLDTYYIKRYFAEPDDAARSALLSSVFTATMLWNCVAVVLCSGVGWVAFRAFHISVPFFPMMFVGLLANLGQVPFNYATLQYRMRHQAGGFALLTIAQAVLMTGLGLLLVRAGQGALGRLLGMLYGALLAAVAGWVTLWPHLRPRLDRALLRDGLRFALPLVPVALITLLFDSIDRLFIERQASLRDLGYYNVAMQYGAAVSILSLSLYRAYEPGYFEMAARGAFDRMNRAFGIASVMFAVSALGLMVGSGPLITLLTHGRFAPSAPLANLLLVGFFLKAVYLLANVLLTIVGRTKAMMWISLLGLVLYVLTTWAGLHWLGIAGAAYAKVPPLLVLIGLSVALSGKARAFRSMLLLNGVLLAILTAAAIGLAAIQEPLTRAVLSLISF